MPSIAAITIYLFGVTSFLAGLNTLLSPESALESFNLSPSSLPPMLGNGLAATAMGLYYCLAAWQENRTFFFLTVPMRTLTATIFWNVGGTWRLAAYWEGAGAFLTLVALISCRRWGSFNQEGLQKRRFSESGWFAEGLSKAYDPTRQLHVAWRRGQRLLFLYIIAIASLSAHDRIFRGISNDCRVNNFYKGG